MFDAPFFLQTLSYNKYNLQPQTAKQAKEIPDPPSGTPSGEHEERAQPATGKPVRATLTHLIDRPRPGAPQVTPITV